LVDRRALLDEREEGRADSNHEQERQRSGELAEEAGALASRFRYLESRFFGLIAGFLGLTGGFFGAATGFLQLGDPLIAGGCAAFDQLADLSWDVG
jgi:hypothetical protein